MATNIANGWVILLLSLFAKVLTNEVVREENRCYNCLYGKPSSGEHTGSPSCYSPKRNDIAFNACQNGGCYVVRVDDKINDISYIQRGCLPGCQNSMKHNVKDYGRGTMECCVGDLCNHAAKAQNMAVFTLIPALIVVLVLFVI